MDSARTATFVILFTSRVSFAWRITVFLLMLCMMGWLIFRWRVELANFALPWFNFVCELFEHSYRIAEFNVQKNQQEWVFHLRLVSEGATKLYGHHFPHLDVSATTLVTHYLQHLFVFGAALFSGLLFVPIRWPIFLTALILSLLLSVGMDIPLTLLGSIEGLILQNLAPERLDSSLLVIFERAMNNGGRMGLALGLSLFCLLLAMRETPKR